MSQLVREKGERHSVTVSGRRQRWRVDVGVCVDPDHTEVRVDTCVAEDWTDRHAVVAAKHNALTAGLQRLLDRISDLHHEI